MHSSRTAAAAVASVLTARLFHLPETYWAPIATLVITQSSLRTALVFPYGACISGQRFIGTMLGAAVGAMASHFGPEHACVRVLHSDRSAYRFAGVTLAIVLLVRRTSSPSQIALHRFSEVCVGLGVALILTTVWPEKKETSSGAT